MKILELDLVAFGPFTNILLDLSGGREGLHVIYGRNEAGKTSSLRALKALLYGIPHNTTDNFLHENQALRLGGRLRHSDGSEIKFNRRKGTKKTILAPDGTPLDDRILEKFLGGIAEQVFTTMFGINHDILVSGGQDLLQGGGEVGQSLFAAGLGATGLSAFLKELEGEMRGLFLPSGANPAINQALAAYKEAKRKIAELSLPGRDWSRHTQALEEALNRRAKVVGRILELSEEKLRLERFEKALPKIGKRGTLLERIENMGQVVVVSPEFSEERREVMDTLRPAEEGYTIVAGELQRLEQQACELKIPKSLLHQKETITALHQRLGAHLKAAKDSSGLEGGLQELEAKAIAHLANLRPDLNLETVEEIRLTAAARRTIQELAGQHQALELKLERAKQDVEKAQGDLETTKKALQNMPVAKDPGELEFALNKSQKKGDIEETQDDLQGELDKLEGQLLVSLQRLGLWSGPLGELEKLAVPLSETVDRFEFLLGDQEAEIARLDEKIAAAMEEEGNLEEQLAALLLTGEIPSEEELAQSRDSREQGWQLVRRSWLMQDDVSQEAGAYDPEHELAEAYEKRVTLSDEISDRLRREAERVAAQATLMASIEARKESLTKLSDQKRRSLHLLDEIKEEWANLWKPIGILPLPPREMRAWLSRQDHLALEVERWRSLQGDLKSVQIEIAEHKAHLRDALNNLQEPAPRPEETLEVLLARCQQIVAKIRDDARQMEVLEGRIEELERELGHARRMMVVAGDKLQEWKKAWSKAVNLLGLGGEASPAAAYAVLNEMEELFRSVDQAANSRGRIAGIRRDAEQFQVDVQDLVGHVAPELAELPPEQAAAELHALLTQAQKDAAKLENLESQIKEKKEFLEATRETIRIAQKRLEVLCLQACCRDYREIESIEKRSQEFQVLQEEAAALEELILEQSAGTALEEFIRESSTVNADSIPGQIQEINLQLEQLEGERSEQDESIIQERIELAKMDGNANAAEEADTAQEILAKMRDDVEQYIRLRMGWLILRREIERYREENQGAIITRAAGFFKTLTIGSFASLMVDYNDKDEPILQGVRPSGKRVGVGGMSDGTVDPLYLALRLATLEEYLESHEPMPFVVDDILLKFDDFRAEATLKALYGLSQRTQVIFFTHHQHLVDLARKLGSGDNVIIHQIG